MEGEGKALAPLVSVYPANPFGPQPGQVTADDKGPSTERTVDSVRSSLTQRSATSARI